MYYFASTAVKRGVALMSLPELRTRTAAVFENNLSAYSSNGIKDKFLSGLVNVAGVVKFVNSV